MARWTVDQIPPLDGRTFVVTGANSGLGYETTRQLLRRNAHVIMTARDLVKGSDAHAAIRAEIPHASVELRELDLSDLDSVERFAAGLLADYPNIDAAENPELGKKLWDLSEKLTGVTVDLPQTL